MLLNNKIYFRHMLWNEKVPKRVGVVQFQRHGTLKGCNCRAVSDQSCPDVCGCVRDVGVSRSTGDAEMFRSHCSVRDCNCQLARARLSNTNHRSLWFLLENLAGFCPWFLESNLQFLGVYWVCHSTLVMPGFLLMKSLGVGSRDMECGSLVMSKSSTKGSKG